MNSSGWVDLMEKCQAFVSMFDRQVLIIDNFGIKVYVFDNFKIKSRDFFQNDVIGAQDISVLIEGLQFNVTFNNKLSLESKINNLKKIDFSFGHDNVILLKSVRENVY